MPTEDDATGTVVEVEFQVADPRYPLVSLPAKVDAHAQVEQIIPRGNGAYATIYSFTGASPERVAALVDEHGDFEARLISSQTDAGLVEVLVTDPDEHFIAALAEAGAIPRRLWSADGTAHIVAEIPPAYPPGDVVDEFLAAHPSVEVVAQRQREYSTPLFTRREFQVAIEEVLTPRQREVLWTAYESGYFEWPRRYSGEEIADELGVSHPTFSQHLRKAEQKVFSLLFAGFEMDE